jgi:wyosine [tRNA(Phe)-imidazoG37] synthetase (radical SAM superfamily)
MNNIHITLGEPSDTKNVSSANKKKIPTPSKVSKTQPAFAESETMMEIEKADMVHERERKRLEEKVEEFRSPIKALSFSIMKHHETALFTSIEKRMFGEELQTENNQREVNKNKSTNSISKAKGNPNQFFSIQRLPKQELTYCE